MGSFFSPFLLYSLEFFCLRSLGGWESLREYRGSTRFARRRNSTKSISKFYSFLCLILILILRNFCPVRGTPFLLLSLEHFFCLRSLGDGEFFPPFLLSSLEIIFPRSLGGWESLREYRGSTRFARRRNSTKSISKFYRSLCLILVLILRNFCPARGTPSLLPSLEHFLSEEFRRMGVASRISGFNSLRSSKKFYKIDFKILQFSLFNFDFNFEKFLPRQGHSFSPSLLRDFFV